MRLLSGYVEKVDTLWRKCRSPKIQRISGLHFTPATTTHMPLKTAQDAKSRLLDIICAF